MKLNIKFLFFLLFPLLINGQHLSGTTVSYCEARKYPDILSLQKVFTLQENEKVVIDSIVDGEWCMIIKNDTVGYILTSSIKFDKLSRKYLDNQRAKIEDSIRKQELEDALLEIQVKDAEHKKYCLKTYGKKWGQLVYEKKIQIGMTEEMVLDSWGVPDDINRTVGSWGVHEQWVYGLGQYLYFENGKLTGWQD